MSKIQPIPKKILSRLEADGRAFESLAHRTVFTAYDLASTLRRSLDEVAKALIIKAGPFVAVAVMPAGRRLDTAKLTRVLSKHQGKVLPEAKIVSEKAALKVTEEDERPVAAFASYYGLPLFVDALIAKKIRAVFPAGSFNTSLEMKVKDFLAHENGILAAFTIPGPKPQKPQKNVKKAKKVVRKIKPGKKVVKKTVKKVAKKGIKKVAPKKKSVAKRKK